MKAIVQARMTSDRFPGKVMSMVNGKTLISNVIERLQQCQYVDEIIIAIPSGAGSRNLFDLEKNYKVKVFDVPHENDVAGRFLAVCKSLDIRDFVRVCADSPFIQPWVIDYAISHYNSLVPHYLVTTGMPDGMNAEIVDFKALNEAYPKMDAQEKEHVTLYFENHPREFDCRTLDLKHMSIDTLSDLERLQEISKYAI